MKSSRASRTSPALLVGLASLLTASAIASPGCGGRSELKIPPRTPPEPECLTDEDCPGYDDFCRPVICVDPRDYVDQLTPPPLGVPIPPMICLEGEPPDCDDGDPCTEDVCDDELDQCTYGPVTLDSDGDGYYAPLPGTVAGAPGSCGDDCNDASPDAFPGNPEVCDGVDNDCNGIVDDGADFVPVGLPVQISSDDIGWGSPGGLAYSGQSYLALYTGGPSGWNVYETRIDVDGTKLPPIEERVALQNADSAGAPLVWTGDRYGLSWEDRRDGDWEIYFTLLDGEGNKFIPDTRLTNAFGFSVNNDMAWNGDEFLVVWQDDRNGPYEVMGQRVSVDGVPLGGNVTMSPEQGFGDESPAVAAGAGGYGLAFYNGDAGYGVIRFRIFDLYSLEPTSELIELTDGVIEPVYPDVVWNEDHYLVVWGEQVTAGMPAAIHATTISPEGTVLVPATQITSPGPYRSREPYVLPLGDRALVLYADDRDTFGDSYELYSRMIGTDLAPLGPEQRLTNAADNSTSPIAAFGPDGDVGIVFEDRRTGEDHVWFTRLGCVVATP